MSRRMFVLFLVLILLSLVACQTGKKVSTTKSDSTTSNQTTTDLTTTTKETPSEKVTLTYTDIVNRLYDLKSLANKPIEGEKSSQFSSYDRSSNYNSFLDQYRNWHANGDWGGVIRKQGDGGEVIAEMEGPGYITRIWSANPQNGRIKIFLDGSTTPVIDMPFKLLFTIFGYSQLSYTTPASGANFYIPIPYNKSAKVVLYGGFGDNGWGSYYLLDYTTLPKHYEVPTFKYPLDNEAKQALSKVNNFFLSNLGTNPHGFEVATKHTNSISLNSGETKTIYESNSPKAITGLKIKINDELTEPFEEWEVLKELTISAFWDNEANPSIWASVGDFFGNPANTTYTGLPMGILNDGWMYSYWYMPFEKAKLTIKNEGTKVRNIDVEIYTEELSVAADDLLRFHAKWSRSIDAPKSNSRWPDSRILYTTGQGRYVGTMIHVYKVLGIKDPESEMGDYWWGEGDEKFFVDGEKFPSWFGTGTEDYFGYAWCNPTIFTKAFHSQPYTQGGVHGIGNIINNRFHIIDNIPFQSSFDGYIEKYYRDAYATRAAMVYWYLDKDGTDEYVPVSLEERMNYFHYKPVISSSYEGEHLFIKSFTGGIVEVQDMAYFGTHWSNNAHLWWRGGKINDTLTFYINVAEAGTYTIKGKMTTAVDYGKVEYYANGVKFSEAFDLYTPNVTITDELIIGTTILNEGLNEITVKIVGKNSTSIDYMFGLDYIKLEKNN